MRILVTGGAGFIGRHLCERLCQNHNVVIYDNLSTSSIKGISHLLDKVEFVCGDILDYEELLKNSKVDVVIHLAAQSDVSKSVEDPDETFDVNVNGTQNVCKVCVENKVKKIIFASSAAVYGDCNDTITENTATNPLSPYGSSKLQAEKIIKDSKTDYVILRIFNVYGKGQNKSYAGVITKFLQNVSEKKPLEVFGDGTQTRDFVSVYDVVDAFEKAITKNGIYNIASGDSITINKLADIVCKKFGECEIKHLQKKKGDIQDSIADVTLAKNELGFVTKRKLDEEITSIYHA